MKEYASLLKDMNTNKNIVWATGEDKEKEITEKEYTIKQFVGYSAIVEY